MENGQQNVPPPHLFFPFADLSILIVSISFTSFVRVDGVHERGRARGVGV